MTPEKFIEKAIEGGYRKNSTFPQRDFKDINIHRVFLDPKAWEAVGKTEGWEDCYCEGCNRVYPEYVNGCIYHETDSISRHVVKDPYNRYHQYRMIDHIAEGGTPESYITTL